MTNTETSFSLIPCCSTLFLSGFAKNTTRKQILKMVEKHGRILHLDFIYKYQHPYAFAEFDDMRDAVDALQKLNNTKYKGQTLRVQYKNPKLKKSGNSFINNEEDTLKHNISSNQTIEQKSNSFELLIEEKKTSQITNKTQSIRVNERKQKNKAIKLVQQNERQRSRQKKWPKVNQPSQNHGQKTNEKKRHYSTYPCSPPVSDCCQHKNHNRQIEQLERYHQKEIRRLQQKWSRKFEGVYCELDKIYQELHRMKQNIKRGIYN